MKKLMTLVILIAALAAGYAFADDINNSGCNGQNNTCGGTVGGGGGSGEGGINNSGCNGQNNWCGSGGGGGAGGQGGVGGNGGAGGQGGVAAVTNDNYVGLTNENYNGQDQRQKQKQQQQQAQGQGQQQSSKNVNANANSNSNSVSNANNASQTTTFNAPNIPNNTPDVHLGGPASGPCNGFSGGIGVSVPGFGLGANTSTVDRGCSLRELARVAHMVGRPDIANKAIDRAAEELGLNESVKVERVAYRGTRSVD